MSLERGLNDSIKTQALRLEWASGSPEGLAPSTKSLTTSDSVGLRWGWGRGDCLSNDLQPRLMLPVQGPQSKSHQTRKGIWALQLCEKQLGNKHITCPARPLPASLPSPHLPLHPPGFSSHLELGTATVSNKEQKLLQIPKPKKMTSRKARRGEAGMWQSLGQ